MQSRICDATYGNIYSRDNDIFRLVASHNTPSAFTEYRRRNPMTGSGAHWADPMRCEARYRFTLLISRWNKGLLNAIHRLWPPSSSAARAQPWPSRC